MALTPDNTLISNRELLVELLKAPLRAVGRGLAFLAENNSRTQALRAIAALSDEELAARGITRAEAISQAFRYDG